MNILRYYIHETLYNTFLLFKFSRQMFNAKVVRKNKHRTYLYNK